MKNAQEWLQRRYEAVVDQPPVLPGFEPGSPEERLEDTTHDGRTMDAGKPQNVCRNTANRIAAVSQLQKPEV